MLLLPNPHNVNGNSGRPEHEMNEFNWRDCLNSEYNSKCPTAACPKRILIFSSRKLRSIFPSPSLWLVSDSVANFWQNTQSQDWPGSPALPPAISIFSILNSKHVQYSQSGASSIFLRKTLTWPEESCQLEYWGCNIHYPHCLSVRVSPTSSSDKHKRLVC